MAADSPRISIIIPCLNEEANIGPCLQSLVQQSMALHQYEILVVDGGSTDATGHLVRQMAEQQPAIRLVVEPTKGTAAGRNSGIKASRGQLIAFIDADCEAPAEWLATLDDHYQRLSQQDPQLVAVGGGNVVPPGAPPFLAAIGVALDSYAGSFNSAQGRQFVEHRQVASLATLNALYDKKRLLEVGCFDQSLGSEAEDADLNHRLGQRGYTMYFMADSFVYHKMRPTPVGWLKNMVRYGRGRARLLKRYPEMWQLSFVLPLIFALVMGVTALTPWWLWAGGGLLYFPLALLLSARQSLSKGRPGLLFHVFLVYLIQHFGYAWGEVYGLVHPRVR